MQTPIHLVYEGQTDQVVMFKLFEYLSLPDPIKMNQGGKNNLLRKLPSYNQAAYAYGHWVVIVDLDGEAGSSDKYAQILLPKPAKQLYLCVAVQAIESWLLADQENFSRYLGIPLNRFPTLPDKEPDPKRTIMSLVRLSRKKRLQEDFLPIAGGTAKIGPGYVSRIAEFVNHESYRWRPGVALQSSPSLERCVDILRDLK